ncbi:MAG: SLC13 family permease [Alphaproteobacteria bacterium]|nr:SLC13 family permease [Alphaproteobacteria bacterium]
MTLEQGLIFLIITSVFGLLLWGRWRYDSIAFGALILAASLRLITVEQTFAGFGHPAVIIIALVLLISKGLSNSGAIELISAHMTRKTQSMTTYISSMSALAALLSAIMNNVAALTLLMPVDIKAAKKAKRSPALTLMPLSFASILGGMITLIGTPSNIIVATFREKALGKPYMMFDFTPVGIVVAIVGVIYIVTIGRKLIPVDRMENDSPKALHDLAGFIADAHVPEKSSAIGKKVNELYKIASEHDVHIIGLVRNGKRLAGYAYAEEIIKNDILVLEATTPSIEPFVGALGLEFADSEKHRGFSEENLTMSEVIVPENSRIAYRSATDLQLPEKHDVTLLGVSRQGQRFREQVPRLKIHPGDLLLLLGGKNQLSDVINWLGCLPIAQRDQNVFQRKKAGWAAGLFAIMILSSAIGAVPLPVALSICVIAYVSLKIISPSEIYQSIEWPVIILLGSLIPIGSALETSGGTALIAQTIIDLTTGAPIIIVLSVLMIVTMCLSDLLNNVATALIAAPIALDLANKLHVNSDPFLMVVAVSSSCAFLTPIGHKNNILILGPGGYRFSDFWRMGLPLEILVILISLPIILTIWPL